MADDARREAGETSEMANKEGEEGEEEEEEERNRYKKLAEQAADDLMANKLPSERQIQQLATGSVKNLALLKQDIRLPSAVLERSMEEAEATGKVSAEFIRSVGSSLTRQNSVNQANSSLVVLNLVANWANYTRANKMLAQFKHVRDEIVAGKARIYQLEGILTHQSDRIKQLEENIATLETSLSEEKHMTETMKGDLITHKQTLVQTVAQYKQDMALHETQLDEQKKLLNNLNSHKLSQDMYMDLFLAFSSLYLVNLSLVEMPLSAITAVASGGNRRLQVFLTQLGKLLLIGLFYQQAKLKFGATSDIRDWAPLAYDTLTHLFQSPNNNNNNSIYKIQ